MGSLHSITLHRLELISFLAIPGNKCCHGNTFLLFLGPIYKHFVHFVGSLHSKLLHGLELTSFSTIPGNKCCHGNTFLQFHRLINNFMGSLHSITLHRLQLISFSAIPGNKFCHGNTILLFLGPTYKYFCGFFAFHTPTRIGAA